MVMEHDVVRARWVLAAAGLDLWPDEDRQPEHGAALAC